MLDIHEIFNAALLSSSMSGKASDMHQPQIFNFFWDPAKPERVRPYPFHFNELSIPPFGGGGGGAHSELHDKNNNNSKRDAERDAEAGEGKKETRKFS
jgi:hypothetical protein